MAAEDFFNRWTKAKSVAADALTDGDAAAPLSPISNQTASQQNEKIPAALPTMQDVEKLNHESDFSAYMSSGVDEDVKRSAMKKLFSNPHFNIMDRLDIYIDDYHTPDPMPPGMLEALLHGKALLDPLGHLQKKLQELINPSEQLVLVPGASTAASQEDNLLNTAIGNELDSQQFALPVPSDLLDNLIPVSADHDLSGPGSVNPNKIKIEETPDPE
ncbi:DUF3306 domain-containing protein [Undibacterium sp. Jales W-56]|uniref:DUF3306 domain-containing protein n=1 Tax=Undibacterium sp. Jales W-56 TaxID=2897325 RepID=UPI0021D27528|nr:DUF3306 domain-containing protein [Undibacterium sp. Jales W-56]MCU6432898.1 DUF3306 domain-containing protein [Undibacterium sp. Jales W-56]